MQAFADKGKFIADPDFVELPYEGPMSKDYARDVAKKLDMMKASPSIAPSEPQKYRSDTVHFSVIDRERNVVAMTESIECYFGSGVVVPGTGSLLNDQMHDFDPEPGGINSIQPGKRPASSMAPVILLGDETFMTLGGAGGPRIISSTIAVVTNVVDFGMDIREAVGAPRFHYQNKEVSADPAIPQSVQSSVKAMGHKVTVRDVVKNEWWYFGAVQAIIRDRKTGYLTGAADHRRDSEAIGY